MTYIVHYTGEWIRSDCDTAATRTESRVSEYYRLEDIPQPDRQQFDWMLAAGEIVTSMGSYVYQIRRES